MKKLNLKKLTNLIILSFLLTSCGKLQPPDVPVCAALSQRLTIDPITKHIMLAPSPTCIKQIGETQCGHCTYIVSGKEVFVGESKVTYLNGKPWSQIRDESILVPAEEAYSPLAAYMINVCKKMKCSDELTRFKVLIDRIPGK